MRPIGPLIGVQREIVTLPLLLIFIAFFTLIWRRARLSAASKRMVQLSFEDAFAAVAPEMTDAVTSSSPTVHRGQTVAVREALGGFETR